MERSVEHKTKVSDDEIFLLEFLKGKEMIMKELLSYLFHVAR